MRFAIMWSLVEGEKFNKDTYKSICDEIKLAKDHGNTVEVYVNKADFKGKMDNFTFTDAAKCLVDENKYARLSEWYNKVFDQSEADLITAIGSMDSFHPGLFNHVVTLAKKNSSVKVFSTVKMMDKDRDVRAVFTSNVLITKNTLIDLNSEYSVCPYYMMGTFIHKDIYKKKRFKSELDWEDEVDFFIDIMMEEKKFYFMPNDFYYIRTAMEGDYGYYPPMYELSWYYQTIQNYWVKKLSQIKDEKGAIPAFVQYKAMHSINARIVANRNNRNKHLIEKEDVIPWYESLKPFLDLIDDEILLNKDAVKSYNCPIPERWIFFKVKYGESFDFEVIPKKNVKNAKAISDLIKTNKIKYPAGDYLGLNNYAMQQINCLFVNIMLTEYRNKQIEIDGNIHSVIYSMMDEIYLKDASGQKFKLVYNERYALTKIFGLAMYKSRSFHVTLPLNEQKKWTLQFVGVKNGIEVPLGINCKSHFSKFSLAFKQSHWTFDHKKWMGTCDPMHLYFRPCNALKDFAWEFALLFRMLVQPDMQSKKFFLLRNAYHVCKPFMKRRPVWLYMDKLYKGGDSSEYLYKYASQQPEKIDHYYLVDKKATDYKRLKREGYEPLVRASFKHRLIFLYSDMLIASNSTVCAFNNYGLPNSGYMRDLLNFNVCCVQHGMSVQKIAVAQNRLRDNTKLYFCASNYEIENLSRPVYNYEGSDALKLTGVPRYDGLKDRHVKQIMISPTWRMQAAVPVRTSEGEQRDYNPLFKETTYFKIYNDLINDPRLVEAAKAYGYRIKYVLHPIVSSQVRDFKKNDYVDIVPAVGDMSYEDMFCESALMVTDFSGIQFDFAYMRKPVVYLHHKDIPEHYDEGSFFYDTMGFGEICHDNTELINLLVDYMKNDCVMKEEYVRRADDFFYFDDHDNCKRIYKEMLAYQDKYVLNN